jgi:hypothetical protein
LIELLDFNLRGGSAAPSAAERVARVTERYLMAPGSRDAMAVVNEIVAWLGDRDPAPRRLRLELSVTASVVRVCVTASQRIPSDESLDSNEVLRRTLPVTAALAPRYGIEARWRTRVWAEFDRHDAKIPSYSMSQYS